jgi:hypothetical protein
MSNCPNRIATEYIRPCDNDQQYRSSSEAHNSPYQVQIEISSFLSEQKSQ